MNTPRMKEAWESSSRTADGFYLTTTPMSVYARSCYEEGCKLERELATVTAQRDRLAEEVGQLKSRLTQTMGAVTISRNGYVQELEQQRDRLAEVMTQILNTQMNHTRRELLLEQALQSLPPKP